MVPTRDGGCWRCGVSVMPLRYHAPADRGSGWWWPTLELAQQCGAKFRIASSIRATHQIVQVDIQVEDAFGDLRSLLFSEVPLACLPNAAAELSAAKPRDGGEDSRNDLLIELRLLAWLRERIVRREGHVHFLRFGCSAGTSGRALLA